MDLKGRIALVTGGSRGIGRAISMALAEAGADVAINFNSNAARAAETVEAIKAKGVRAAAFQANIANDEENHRMVEAIHNQLGPVAVLVNNAGITRDRTFAKMTYDAWKEVLDTNLTGQAMVTHALLPDMIEQKWGRVVFITSVIGQMGNFGQSNYAAAKGALIALTKSLARETARKGVTVNAVAPGFIETDMTASLSAEQRGALERQIPLERLGAAADIAAAVLFLCSPGAGYVTGEVINVNGGMYMA